MQPALQWSVTALGRDITELQNQMNAPKMQALDFKSNLFGVTVPIT